MFEDRVTRKLPFDSASTIAVRSAIAAGVVIAAGAFAAGLVVGGHGTASGLIGAGEPRNVDLSPVWKAWQVIDQKFVPASVATSTPIATSTEQANKNKVWGMVQGLAESLNDPYTYFMPPVESQQFSQDLSGEFGGVGMEVDVKDQVLTVVSPLKGTPADKAGIKSADQVLKIDGVSTRGMDVTTAVSKIRGPKGTEVTLQMLRSGWSAPRDIKVTRDVINVPTIMTKARPDGVFVIQLMTFTSNSPDLFRGALREFIQSGDTKLVLDLRGNPGGYLEAAVDMASWFLPSGDVVVTEDYAGHSTNIVHRSLGYNVFNKNLTMVILIDRGSASASEILADALHHYGVAQLVGTNSFGKGSVQELVDITSDTSLKVTVARWLGPDGVQIPLTGITPDIQVSVSDDDIKSGKDPQLQKAVDILTGKTQ